MHSFRVSTKGNKEEEEEEEEVKEVKTTKPRSLNRYWTADLKNAGRGAQGLKFQRIPVAAQRTGSSRRCTGRVASSAPGMGTLVGCFHPDADSVFVQMLPDFLMQWVTRLDRL